jgi:phytoene dehydrogenase-like protein
MMTKKVCVIGAGIGGLTAAVYLAKAGYQVTVLEKATTVGGSAGWYVRQGRLFPTGATIAFGLEKGGLLKEILDELGIQLQLKLLMHPMNVILPDRSVAIYQQPLEWNKELVRAFPEHSENVLHFWRTLEYISNHVYQVSKHKVALPIKRLYDLEKLPKYVLTHPIAMLRITRYMFWTVKDLLQKFQLDTYKPFCQFLDAQLLDAVQTDHSEAALLPSSLALDIYRKGSYYVQGGMGQISLSLSKRLESLGSRLLLNTAVNQVSFLKDKAKWQVISKKGEEAFDIVINNSGRSFGHMTSHQSEDALSWGAFRLDALLQESVWQESLKGCELPFAYQIMIDSSDIKMQQPVYFHGPIYVTFQKALDKHWHPVEKEILMTVSVHTRIDEWASLSPDAYQNRKRLLLENILSEIEKTIPIKAYLLKADAGTPLTYQRYIGKQEVGGFPLTVQQAILRPNSVRSSLPHWYMAGEQAFPGPGTLSAALSGYYAARTVMQEEKS